MSSDFKKWVAGYFSWVEQNERMPKDFDDLERMVEDAYNAGAHSMKLASDNRILEFKKLFKDNPGMNVTEAESVISIRNSFRAAEQGLFKATQHLKQALKLTSHQRFLFWHNEKKCEVCALEKALQGDDV